MSRADLDKWEPRYASGRGYGRDPDTWLRTVGATFLPSTGTAVDLAGGSGRHARWLAGRGLATTVVDIAPSGLAQATARAAEEGHSLSTVALDLDEGLPEGTWDVVLVTFFLLRPLLPTVHRLVAPGGVLLHVHPTLTNLGRHARPSARWLLAPGEVTAMPGLITEHLEEGWDPEGRHTLRYVGRRPIP